MAMDFMCAFHFAPVLNLWCAAFGILSVLLPLEGGISVTPCLKIRDFTSIAITKKWLLVLYHPKLSVVLLKTPLLAHVPLRFWIQFRHWYETRGMA